MTGLWYSLLCWNGRKIKINQQLVRLKKTLKWKKNQKFSESSYAENGHGDLVKGWLTRKNDLVRLNSGFGQSFKHKYRNNIERRSHLYWGWSLFIQLTSWESASITLVSLRVWMAPVQKFISSFVPYVSDSPVLTTWSSHLDRFDSPILMVVFL